MILAILLFLPLGIMLIWGFGLIICPHYLDANDIDNKIEFDSLKKFYPINPNKWTLCEGYVMYNSMTLFKFNFIDYWRYRSWLKQQRKMKKIIESNDALAAVIQDVKADIAKFEAENEAYIQSKLDELRL